MIDSTPKSHAVSRRSAVPWTADETRRVADLWRTGMTAVGIARAVGKSRNAVLGKIGRLGLSRCGRGGAAAPVPTGAAVAAGPVPRPRRYTWSREHQSRLVALWRDGHATDEIAARLGCTESLVVERATAAGLASVEVPERHSSPGWFARNDARFRAAMQRAVDRGHVVLPTDLAETSPEGASVASRVRVHGR